MRLLFIVWPAGSKEKALINLACHDLLRILTPFFHFHYPSLCHRDKKPVAEVFDSLESSCISENGMSSM